MKVGNTLNSLSKVIAISLDLLKKHDLLIYHPLPNFLPTQSQQAQKPK